MLNANILVGGLLVALGALAELLSFAIAMRQYVLQPRPPHSQRNAADPGSPWPEILKSVKEILVAIFSAPPALVFFVGGLVLLAAGGYVLYQKPF